MMDNETDMIIYFICVPQKWVIYVTEDQNLQIPIFIVFVAPDVQLTQIKYESSVVEIYLKIHENPVNPDS